MQRVVLYTLDKRRSCDQCTRVLELNGCPVKIDRLAGRHFCVRRHELVLYGTRAECATHRWTIPQNENEEQNT